MLYDAKNASLPIADTGMDYIRFGTGKEVLIMLPGLGDGLRTTKGTALPMAAMYRMFARDFTVYAFSRRDVIREGTTTKDMADDIAFAMDAGVGYFIVDSLFELDAIQAEAEKRGIVQKVLLRLTPGIDPHTYEAVATGKVDSKFGVAIETGQAEVFVVEASMCANVKVSGYHCHVGSQVFDEDGSVYTDAADIMLKFMAEMNEKYALGADILNMGGGYGVRYVESDPYVDIPANIHKVAAFVKDLAAKLNMPVPKILMEPGRSIVADAGMTLYTVGTIKKIPGYKNYTSIDGGMTDNPRFALYQSQYTVYLANRMNEENTFTSDVVGRCCESGDIIQPDVMLPEPNRGDIVAVCTTGAYNYSMASNYNRVPRPPVVMLRGGESYLAVKRESYADLLLNDV